MTTTHTFATANDPSIYVELAGVTIPAATISATADAIVAPRAAIGTVIKVKDASTLGDLPDTATLANGYISFTVDADTAQLSVLLSADGGTTWVGPFWSKETWAGQANAGVNAQSALDAAAAAQSTADAALYAAQAGGSGGAAATTWDSVTSKPTTFPPSPHSHTSGDISDASALGRLILEGADAASVRGLIGAGTGNGTSNLTLGSSATQAAPGNHLHTGVYATPADVDAKIAAAGTGGGVSSVTLTNVPGGLVTSSSTTTRRTTRSDLMNIFNTGTTDPGSAALDGDVWVRQ